jgi:hypothetical protein
MFILSTLLAHICHSIAGNTYFMDKWGTDQVGKSDGRVTEYRLRRASYLENKKNYKKKQWRPLSKKKKRGKT